MQAQFKLRTDSQKKSIGVIVLLTISGVVLSTGWRWHNSLAARQIKVSAGQIESDTLQYDKIIKTLPEYDRCLRIPIRKVQGVSIGYPFCSDLAMSIENQSFKITESFHVPKELPQKFMFWSKIYSQWLSSQFVVHSSAYPELVLEILELENANQYNHAQQWNKVKGTFEANRKQYRAILMALHNNRNHLDQIELSPAMERIVRKMEHIADKNKYLRAALSIRAQRGQKDFIKQGYEQATRYLPHIKNIFRSEGVPEELAYITFVESSFNLKARSKVGASGVFQIMPATGRQYMIVGDLIDERNDPIKAARAAAKVFRLNYRLTGSWPLSVIAYNHGVGSVRRAVKAVGSKDIVKIVNGYEDKSFGFASKNFYFEYIAMLYTIMNIDKVFPDVYAMSPISFQEIKLREASTITGMANKHKVPINTLQELNPDISRQAFRSNALLPKGYVLKIPAASVILSHND